MCIHFPPSLSLPSSFSKRERFRFTANCDPRGVSTESFPSSSTRKLNFSKPQRERERESHVSFSLTEISEDVGMHTGSSTFNFVIQRFEGVEGVNFRIGTHVSGDDDQRGGDGEQGDGQAEFRRNCGWLEGRGGVILPIEPRAE